MKKNLLSVVAAFAILVLTFSTVMAHEHHPPHKGTLVVLGEEFSHVELLLDSDTGQLTAFVLDGEAENPVRVSQSSLVIKLKDQGQLVALRLKPIANALTGETVGDTSEYQGTFSKLKGLSHFEGYIASIKSRGESFKNVRFLYPKGNEGVKWPDEKGAGNVSK
jgi:hypothetical protein